MKALLLLLLIGISSARHHKDHPALYHPLYYVNFEKRSETARAWIALDKNCTQSKSFLERKTFRCPFPSNKKTDVKILVKAWANDIKYLRIDIHVIGHAMKDVISKCISHNPDFCKTFCFCPPHKSWLKFNNTCKENNGFLKRNQYYEISVTVPGLFLHDFVGFYGALLWVNLGWCRKNHASMFSATVLSFGNNYQLDSDGRWLLNTTMN